MTIFKKEMRTGFKSLMTWAALTAVIQFAQLMIFPEMKTNTDQLDELMSNFGAFTTAFGLDKLNMGTIAGYYGAECGTALAIIGGMFAAFLGISILSKEEKEHTAEFLFSNPISRASVLWQKFAAMLLQITIFNFVIYVVTLGAIALLGEAIPWAGLTKLSLAFMIVEYELGAICFGISTFLSRGTIGLGLGFAFFMYFLDIIKNLTSQADFLKYITPYSYAEPSELMAGASLEVGLIALGALYAALVFASGFLHYLRKDLR